MQDLAALLSDRRAVALTGAGCSTASGIPDYRGAGRPPRKPIQHHDFVTSEAHRRRYWARAVVGWPVMRAARPNAAHHALATAACHAATRRGDRLEVPEAQALFSALDARVWFPNCPHGRPICYTLSAQELERRFLRS